MRDDERTVSVVLLLALFVAVVAGLVWYMGWPG